MPVHVPAEVARGCLVDRPGHGGKIRGDVMLEAVFANVVEQPLHLRNFDDPRAAESVERIVGKFAFADIAANLASSVVGGEARRSSSFQA